MHVASAAVRGSPDGARAVSGPPIELEGDDELDPVPVVAPPAAGQITVELLSEPATGTSKIETRPAVLVTNDPDKGMCATFGNDTVETWSYTTLVRWAKAHDVLLVFDSATTDAEGS